MAGDEPRMPLQSPSMGSPTAVDAAIVAPPAPAASPEAAPDEPRAKLPSKDGQIAPDG